MEIEYDAMLSFAVTARRVRGGAVGRLRRAVEVVEGGRGPRSARQRCWLRLVTRFPREGVKRFGYFVAPGGAVSL